MKAYNFTPWLAKNLDLLGNEIGMKLELVQMEKAVGPMSLDILAKEVDTGDMVAIENQLEWTDTHHLGQLMTYSGEGATCGWRYGWRRGSLTSTRKLWTGSTG